MIFIIPPYHHHSIMSLENTTTREHGFIFAWIKSILASAYSETLLKMPDLSQTWSFWSQAENQSGSILDLKNCIEHAHIYYRMVLYPFPVLNYLVFYQPKNKKTEITDYYYIPHHIMKETNNTTEPLVLLESSINLIENKNYHFSMRKDPFWMILFRIRSSKVGYTDDPICLNRRKYKADFTYVSNRTRFYFKFEHSRPNAR